MAMERAGYRIFGDLLGQQCYVKNRFDPRNRFHETWWRMKQVLVSCGSWNRPF